MGMHCCCCCLDYCKYTSVCGRLELQLLPVSLKSRKSKTVILLKGKQNQHDEHTVWRIMMILCGYRLQDWCPLQICSIIQRKRIPCGCLNKNAESLSCGQKVRYLVEAQCWTLMGASATLGFLSIMDSHSKKTQWPTKPCVAFQRITRAGKNFHGTVSDPMY